MSKAVKKTQEDSNIALDDVLKSEKYKKTSKDNQKDFLKKATALCTGQTDVNEDLNNKIKKLKAGAEVVANL